MMKHILLLTSFILCFHFSYSQEEKITPLHIIKFDVLKSSFCQFHFDYERYNGKRLGLELGVGIIYPNRVISYIDEEPTDFGWYDRTAGHYRGYSLEFTQKFYFPNEHWNPYLGITLSHKYKHCENAKVLNIDEFRSSSYSYYETFSSKRYIESISLMTGFVSSFKKLFSIDLNIGIGLGYFNVWKKENDRNIITEGANQFYAPVFKCGAKLCFGFKGKSK
jgi:hypothetical protein